MEEIKTKRIFGLERNIFFLGLVSLLNDFSAEMIQAVMPVFLTVALGAPAAVVGIIEGTADAVSSVLKLFSGWFSDKLKKRKIFAVVGYSISVSIRSVLSTVTSFGQVFALRVTDRIGKGLRDSPRDALITESVGKEELGMSFGFHRSMDTLGATLGPLAAFLLLPVFGFSYRTLFLFAFFIGIFAVVSFVFVKDKKPAPVLVKKPRPKLDWKLLRANKRFAKIVLAIFVFGLGTLPISLTLLEVREVSPKLTEVPLMYFIYGLAFVLTSLPLGKLSDKIGTRPVIAFGFAIAALTYFGLAHHINLWIDGVLFAALGLYSAATDGIERALASKLLPPEVIATGQGFLNMAVGFSSLGAGIIGGLLWSSSGSSAALSYAGYLSLVGFVLFLFMTKKEQTYE